MRRFSFLILILLTGTMAFPQGRIIPAEAFADARQYMLSNEYQEALPLLHQLEEKGYVNAHIHYLTGLCYLNIAGKKELAIEELEKAVQNISSSCEEERLNETAAPPQALFFLGVAYRINGRNKEAINIFRRVREELLPDEESEKLITRELRFCQMEECFAAIPVPVYMEKIQGYVNTSGDEYLPVVSAAENTLAWMAGKKFYDAIYTSTKDSAKWGAPDEITTELGSDGEFSVVSLSADGNTLLLTAYDMYSGGDLYFSQYRDTRWQKKQKFPAPINSAYNENSGSLSPDGKTLFFSSNRTGGAGGSDIYSSALNTDGTWGAAVNLGPYVNSREDEISPILSPDKKYLWFSSKGHSSIGGFDVFRATLMPDGYSWPVNVGIPLNTPEDDAFFAPVSQENTGFMARPDSQGRGTRDIFRMNIKALPDPARFHISVEVSANDQPDVSKINARLKFSTPSGNGERLASSTGFSYTSMEKSGQFWFSTSAPGYDADSAGFGLAIDSRDSARTVRLQLIKIPPPEESRPQLDSAGPYLLGALYFPFESDHLKEESVQRLDSLLLFMQKHPELHLQVTGHTDQQGPAWYNLQLSAQRAEAVRTHLILKGLPAERIYACGRGEANPIALDLNPVSRQWNRRVELRLQGSTRVEIKYLPPPAPKEYLLH